MMTNADEIATLARLSTTTHEDAVRLIEQYGRVAAAGAAVTAATEAYDSILATLATKNAKESTDA